MRSRSLALGAVGAVILAALALVLFVTPPVSQANPAGLEAQMIASQEGNVVTYSITLVNNSSEDVGDIFVAGLVPVGAKFLKSTETPALSWFRGFEGAGTATQAAVWLSSKVAKNSKQGSFSYQVSVVDNVAANAWVHWKNPSSGSVSSAATVSVKVAGFSDYVGSETCAKCHAGKYNDFRVSGHPYKLRPVSEAKFSPLPLPKGFTWDDISYVIGGANWKARFVDKQGYIITSNGGEPGKNQYNLATNTWSDYHPGEVKKYDCGSCHTTGYSKEGSQDGLPGIVGTWASPGIQCEACHGPGREHVQKGGDKSAIKIDKSAAACGSCHVRGKATEIPASKGFIRHHEQYNEILTSPHKNLDCTACHDPHKKAEFSIKADCTSCHTTVKTDFAGSTMEKVGVKCIDCHMPEATKSAVNFGPNKADVKTHLFTINTDAGANMLTEDGKFANGFVTLNFACLQCHADRNVDWAASYAKNAHTLGKQ